MTTRAPSHVDTMAGLRAVAISLKSHIVVAFVAVVLFGILHSTGGRISAGNGEGWDGQDYSRMLREGWLRGTVHTRLRPLIVWANTPVFIATRSPVLSFVIMNLVYAGLLAGVLSMLLQRYGAGTFLRVIAVVCIAFSNHFRLQAFYPVLIDLGACAVIAVALLLILDGPRWAAALACAAAMLAREYSVILLFFGVHRDWRNHVPRRATIATYVPAAILWIAVRIVASRAPNAEDVTSLHVLLENRYLWADPLFAALFLYFLVAHAGGVSLLVASQPRCCVRFLTREPEWVSYTVPLIVVTAFGGADMWRYFTPLLPVVAVLFAQCFADRSRGEQYVLGVSALALTLWTQAPFKRMDVMSYFADWFPYYIRQGLYPFSSPPPLWPDWGWRFLVVAVAFFVLLAFVRADDSPAHAG